MNEEFRKYYELDTSNKDFEINDLEQFNQRPPVGDNPSQAVSNAMKALQDKIKFLEYELHQSKDQLLAVESKYSSDRDKWQSRLMAEIQLSKERESLLETRLSSFTAEVQKLQQKLVQSEEQAKIKDIQCKFLESESKRAFEQFSVDMESLTLQIEYLQKTLATKTTNEQKLQKTLEKATRDKDFAEEELKQQKRINTGLQSEVNFLRENSEYQRSSLQKNYESVEHELTTQNQDFIQKIKELEIKNKSLREASHNQSQQILHLKKEISEINKMNEEKTLKKIDLIKTKSLTKKPPVKVQSKRSASPVCIDKKKSFGEEDFKGRGQLKGMEKKKSLGEEDFKGKISQCEKEIDRLSGSYRDLVCLTSSGSGDLNGLRKEMTRLASDIEKKNEELYEYKKKQQEFLRERLYN